MTITSEAIEASRKLLEAWDAYRASSGNMEEAYYKLAKYAWNDWEALRAALSVPAAAVVGEMSERLRDLADQRHMDRGLDAVDDALREAASRISQQDAELERLRREVEESEKKFETADKLRVFWNDKATELAGKLDDARSNVFAESALIAYAINTRGETAISLQFLIVRALRAKAEGENHG